jgi:hypothetical protein
MSDNTRNPRINREHANSLFSRTSFGCSVSVGGVQRFAWCTAFRKTSGGARRDRTDDLLLAKQALSQLSYGPVPTDISWSAEPQLARRAITRLRPACASEDWWAWEDLNFRPHAYQARALTN